MKKQKPHVFRISYLKGFSGAIIGRDLGQILKGIELNGKNCFIQV